MQLFALYNSISLHDGNQIINAPSKRGLASYKLRTKNLLDDLDSFFQSLKASKRNVVVVFVPEHGAGMRGDKMQVSGIRDIPSATIVHTPVAMKFFGINLKKAQKTVHISTPSSYLAVSTLISRILKQDIYAKQNVDIKALSKDLPETKVVSQNSGTTVMQYHKKSYVSLDNLTWLEYPSN